MRHERPRRDRGRNVVAFPMVILCMGGLTWLIISMIQAGASWWKWVILIFVGLFFLFNLAEWLPAILGEMERERERKR